MKTISAMLLALLLLTPAAPAFALTLKVAEAAVTTKVSKGKPIDSVHRISYRTVKALYFFTRTVLDEAGETRITHRWLRDGTLVKETTLPVKARRWRAYSSLPVDAGSVGQWRVELLDEGGKLIKTLEFKVH
ncbi:DUF2914 domain-containing protein [Trichlorobacter ammonificans]|uniref:DUF2914 domain-containing protein n=1 Tax=Trichlorobacter ammonificans TaxID=2916410 RepID=A0ABM9D691_9BACT|nr:DUF2914 domain-containing protein [Trichlorobacter ammonificans]CAH2030714.1 conserved exported protein of unknown function [Trichlorobacter ammonificans]